ncbi:hypothetical protein BG011_008792 [Mortierella polycephala]|uniref:Uncharacterized protein n=1 Tax=Mortierella polycephala TaxID=41804 RepID=A0A9P6PMD7_9FUNG|nr:hypothetical protein BG011_008792 [Mortierella polycephala]
MRLSSTSITLFLVHLGCFSSGLIVLVCCCLYATAYPKSPDAGSLSSIALGTLAFSALSTIITLLLMLRQKSGKTIRAMFEGLWVIFATAMWVLAAVGGIISPPNGMTNVTCKILPDGTETGDAYFKRACQAMFASTAFCIVTALCFLSAALILFVFSVKHSVHNHKTKKDKVGGHYQLSMTLSQYRRTEKEAEEGKKLKGAGEHEEEEDITPSGQLSEGDFSDRVYQDPTIAPTTGASSSNHEAFEQPNAHLTFLQQQQYQVHHQLQQQHQQQLQQQQQQDQHQSHYM